MSNLLTTLPDQVRPEHTALVIIDAQNDYLHKEGKAATRRGVTFSHETVEAMNALISAARQADVRTIYVRVVHTRETMPPPRRAFRPNPEDLWPLEGSWGADWYEGLIPPREDDLVLTKYDYDSFNGTSLAIVLRALAIRTLVLTGFSTEVCVDTTARTAFANGWYPVVPRDCTSGFRPEASAAALEVISRFFGKVVSSAELIDVWSTVRESPLAPQDHAVR